MESLREDGALLVNGYEPSDDTLQRLSRDELALHPVGFAEATLRSPWPPAKGDAQRRLGPKAVNNGVPVFKNFPNLPQYFAGIIRHSVRGGRESLFEEAHECCNRLARMDGLG